MSRTRHDQWRTLQAQLKGHSRLLIAFSAGCDSTFLAAAARRTLGKETVLAITAVSASLPARERIAAARLAAHLDVPHQFLETRELDNPDYAANPSNRCFFCKSELYSRLAPMAEIRRMILADGFNVSDRSDFRPGVHAAQQWRVEHPLDDAGLRKQDIRALSRWLRLPTWSKPASPCLSSRIPYGTPVSPAALRQIERAEEILRTEGFPIVRVRHYKAMARIEVPLDALSRLKDPARWPRIVESLQTAGYARVEADLRGYQSGRLNERVRARVREK